MARREEQILWLLKGWGRDKKLCAGSVLFEFESGKMFQTSDSMNCRVTVILY
jgi:hypothetical protein